MEFGIGFAAGILTFCGLIMLWAWIDSLDD